MTKERWKVAAMAQGPEGRGKRDEARARRVEKAQQWGLITLPNVLGYARLAAAPAMAVLVLDGYFVPAFWTYLAAGITDWLDGFIARRFRLTSRFGRFLDPVADKVFVNATFLALASVGLMPLWFAGLVALRDILIGAAFAASRVRRREGNITPLLISKVNTFLQVVLGSALLAGEAFAWPMAEFSLALMMTILATSAVSAVLYYQRWRDYFTARR
ncbi:MAG: CDP-alcohol phosphatidyltransferase family protein [Pseudomonadota bacterium]